jgi:hypothetical protein
MGTKCHPPLDKRAILGYNGVFSRIREIALSRTSRKKEKQPMLGLFVSFVAKNLLGLLLVGIPILSLNKPAGYDPAKESSS